MRNHLFLILILLYFASAQGQEIKTYKINDTRTYEVTAALLPENKIIAVWMEARPERVVCEQAGDMRVAYAVSEDLGVTWSKKKIIDKPNTLLTGNPSIISDKQGDTHLVMMHVGKDFFSGELAVYKYNPQLNEFELKSIAAQSDSSLLDKPSITENKGKLFLSYTEITQMLENSFLKVLSYSDQEKTWKKVPPIAKDSILYLGTSARADSNHLFLSSGTYWNKTVEFFDYNLRTQKAERTTIATTADTLENALSEMVNEDDQLIINWYKNHVPNAVYFSFSKDRGKTWSKPILVSENGNLLSTVFDDDGNIVVLFSEFDNNNFSVIVKYYSTSRNKFLNEFYLKKPTAINDKLDYIGAFQKIIKLQDDSFMAFWIDFSDDNKLYLSKWDARN